jgi:hypothetical protein
MCGLKKDDQTVVPAVVPTGVPTTTAMPKAGPTGTLTPAAEKGRPTGWWGGAAMVEPTTVPVGAPAATTAPVARSREVVAA